MLRNSGFLATFDICLLFFVTFSCPGSSGGCCGQNSFANYSIKKVLQTTIAFLY